MKIGMKIIRQFRDDEEGLALTEYLILLALLTGGVVVSVLLIGDQLQIAWGAWGGFFTDLAGLGAPEIPPADGGGG